MARISRRYVLRNPPLWVRQVGIVLVPVIGDEMAQRRGLVMGLVSAAWLACLMVPAAVSPGGVQRWSQRHPILDSLVAGSLMMLFVLMYFSHWSVLSSVPLSVAFGLFLWLNKAARRRKSARREPAEI